MIGLMWVILILLTNAAAILAEYGGLTPVPDHYVIGSGDVLEITIVPKGEQQLVMNRTISVRHDGFISLEYIGEVKAAGKTIAELVAEIQRRMLEYMQSVDVSINVQQIKAKRFFVLGEVMRPGQYVLESEITVLDAITIAGSYTRYASQNGVKLVREASDHSLIFHIPMKKVAEKGQFQYNQELQDGDVIVVPCTTWAKIGNFFSNAFYPFRDILSVVVSISAFYVVYEQVKR